MVKGQNAYIASSFSKLGPFKFVPTPRPPKGEEGHRVETEPGYPQAYFKKSKTPIQIPPMLPGGKGQPPIKTAWNDTKSVVAEILSRELRISLEQAFQTLVRTSTGTL